MGNGHPQPFCSLTTLRFRGKKKCREEPSRHQSWHKGLRATVPFPVRSHTADLNKETKGKYVCSADVKFIATTVLLVRYFILPSPLPAQLCLTDVRSVCLCCVLYRDQCSGAQPLLAPDPQ